MNKPNKPHRHKDLIAAWANGARIQQHVWAGIGSNQEQIWQNVPKPTWDEFTEYRVEQEQEFKQATWYPVRLVNGDILVLPYYKDAGFIGDSYKSYTFGIDIDWVGEPLKIDWPNR